MSIPLLQTNIPKSNVGQHKRQASDQFSLVTGVQQQTTPSSDQQPKPDMLNDIEFPPPLINRRTSQLIQALKAFEVADAPMDESLMKSVAVDGFLKEMGLPETDRALIEDNIEIKEIPAGTTLTHQGRTDDVLLIYVITGGLIINNQQPNIKSTKARDKAEVSQIELLN